jgi:hypothetical protein
MNTDGLARHYGSLTPAERLSLFMAASARGDEGEGDRLGRSAPRLGWQVPHHFGLGMAFREVSELHRMELLRLAALYLHSFGQAGASSGEVARSLLDSARVFGYLLRVNLEGWRRFCAGRDLDPDLCMDCYPGREVLEMAADLAGRAAFTPEGVLACIQRKDPAASAIPTAEGVAAALGKTFDVRAAWWG